MRILTAGSKKVGRYFGRYNFLGAVDGLIFADLSFLPSLLPRGWVLQGIMTAVLFCIGYGLGVLLSHIIRKFEPREPDAQRKRRYQVYTFASLGVSFVLFVMLGTIWQRQVREL